MARARFIRPEFFTDTKLSDMPMGAALLFAGIWCHSDLNGVFEYDARLLRGLIFPMLAAELINRGERTEFIYTSARLAIRALLDERRIEECQIPDGPIVYRLPASTPMEPKK